MGFAIRTSTEISAILNKSQHAIASLGDQIVAEKKRGITITNRDHRDKVYRLILLRIYLQNILTPEGNLLNYYTASVNEKKLNKILDGLVHLSKSFDGPSIPLLGQKNLPLVFYPGGSSGSSSGGSSGGGPATPGGTVFQGIANTGVTLVDTFNASISQFAFYIVSCSGSGSGEGSRTSIMSATWRGSNNPVFTETKTEDVGGITTPLTLSVNLNAGAIELNATASTDGWTITGLRILFQNISFVNPLGPLPAGGTTGQFLRKSSNLDYQASWQTLTCNMITDLLASATEINVLHGILSTTSELNKLSGVTTSTAQLNFLNTLSSNVQTQLNTLNTALASYLLLSGGNLSGPLAMGGNKITGLAAASAPGDAVRFEQALLLIGGALSGPLAMGTNKITGLAAGTTNGDALRYEQLIGVYLLLTGGNLSGPLAMGGNKITGLAAASAPGDAVRFEQLVGRTVTNGVSRSLDTSFQPSLTKDCLVTYSLFVSSGSTQTPTISLQTSPDDAIYTEIGRFGNRNTTGFGTFQDDWGQLFAYVPTGYYVKLVTTGSGTKTYITGQEMIFG